MSVTSRWNIGHLKDCRYPTIWCFICFIQFFDAISTTIAEHSFMVFYLQQAIHKNITQRFNSYTTIHGKEQHIRQNVIWKIKYLEWLINILSILSFKPYAKSISLSVIFLSPLRCATFTNEATPFHDSMTRLFASFNPYLYPINIVCNV